MSDTSAVKFRKPLSLDEFRKQRKPLRNVNKEASEKLSALDRLACSITNRVGTMGFFSDCLNLDNHLVGMESAGAERSTV